MGSIILSQIMLIVIFLVAVVIAVFGLIACWINQSSSDDKEGFTGRVRRYWHGMAMKYPMYFPTRMPLPFPYRTHYYYW